MKLSLGAAGTLLFALALAVVIACLVIRRWPHDPTNDEEWP